MRLIAVALAILATTASTASAAPLPPVKHVFTIVLENSDFAQTFGLGQVTAPYLTRTLPSQGVLVPNYFGTGHSSLDNYVAMISGQGPNPATQSDCDDASMMPATSPWGPDGQLIGVGCTYPPQVQTLAGQLRGAGLEWKGYMQGMDQYPAEQTPTCRTPGTTVHTTEYRTKHNPFVYFHSVTDDRAACDARDVPLTQLDTDLQSEATTPNYAFIVPDQCSDGHDDCSGNSTQTQLQQIDAFLKQWVPKIEASPAFRHDGLLVVTFDEGVEAFSCCNEAKSPNLGPNSSNGLSQADFGPLTNGGGQVGAVLVSPWIKPGSVSTTAYNHYSYLRSMEDLFGLPHLAYASTPDPGAFGADVFSAWAG